MPDEPAAFPKLIRDLMTVGVQTCSPETPVSDIAQLLLQQGGEAVVVLDASEGHALGVVSEEDLVHVYSHPDVRSLKAEDVMRDGVPHVPPDIPLTTAAQIIQDLGIRALFLMHHAEGIEYPAAVISYQHFLRHLSVREEGDLSDLGISADRQLLLQTFMQRRDAARNRNRLT